AWRDEHTKVLRWGSVEQRLLKDKLVDEYVKLARPRHDAGPHALATLGLHSLKSDALIREAIQEMAARSGTDPWSGYTHYVEDIDLVKFFAWVRQRNHNFLADGTVQDVAQQVKAAGGHRPKPP